MIELKWYLYLFIESSDKWHKTRILFNGCDKYIIEGYVWLASLRLYWILGSIEGKYFIKLSAIVSNSLGIIWKIE
jgi:hypothetical protein